MKNILYHLYHGNLCEADRSTKDLQKTQTFKKRDDSYEKLIATFDERQRELFEEFFVLDGDYEGLEKERIYANGVKTGICLALELLEFEPSG